MDNGNKRRGGTRQTAWIVACALALATITGCRTQHQVETKSEVDVRPIEIKPIHITVDINVKVDRALDNFFDDLDGSLEAR